MPSELWLPAAVLIAIVDFCAAMFLLAKLTDRSYEPSAKRFRFSVSTLLLAMTLLAINIPLLLPLSKLLPFLR
jgi:hypothetical protein